jgi:hypothetical protein
MKYIMIEGCFPVLFHESLNHIDVAQGLCGDPELVTSAAFCKWDKVTGHMVPGSLSSIRIPKVKQEHVCHQGERERARRQKQKDRAEAKAIRNERGKS